MYKYHSTAYKLAWNLNQWLKGNFSWVSGQCTYAWTLRFPCWCFLYKDKLDVLLKHLRWYDCFSFLTFSLSCQIRAHLCFSKSLSLCRTAFGCCRARTLLFWLYPSSTHALLPESGPGTVQLAPTNTSVCLSVRLSWCHCIAIWWKIGVKLTQRGIASSLWKAQCAV